MDFFNTIANYSPLDAPIEQRIRKLAIESDSGADKAKAFLLKVAAEFGLALPVGAAIAVGLYYLIGAVLYNPGPLQEVAAGTGFGTVLRSWCMFGPLSES